MEPRNKHIEQFLMGILPWDKTAVSRYRDHQALIDQQIEDEVDRSIEKRLEAQTDLELSEFEREYRARHPED